MANNKKEIKEIESEVKETFKKKNNKDNNSSYYFNCNISIYIFLS